MACMGTEIRVAGFTLTPDDWAALDDESREILLEALAADEPDEVDEITDDEPYASYELVFDAPRSER